MTGICKKFNEKNLSYKSSKKRIGYFPNLREKLENSNFFFGTLPLVPPKVKNDCKIKSKSKVRTEGTIENKSCSTT